MLHLVDIEQLIYIVFQLVYEVEKKYFKIILRVGFYLGFQYMIKSDRLVKAMNILGEGY